MSNKIIGITSSNFQYQNLGSYKVESDIPEKMGKLEENLLEFTTQFQSGDFTNVQLNLIADELKSTAEYFAVQYGLGESELIKYIYAYRTDNNSIEFGNNAVDKYQRYYAGFVEYGHRSKKTFVPARPFMRNALYMVSNASVNNLGNALEQLLMSTISLSDVHSLEFGDGLSRKNRVVSRMEQAPITVQGKPTTLKTIGGLNKIPNFKERMGTKWAGGKNGKWTAFRNLNPNARGISERRVTRKQLKEKKEKEEKKKEKKKNSKKRRKTSEEKKPEKRQKPKSQKKGRLHVSNSFLEELEKKYETPSNKNKSKKKQSKNSSKKRKKETKQKGKVHVSKIVTRRLFMYD